MDLYEDQLVKVMLPDNGATKGHIVIQTQQGAHQLSDLDEEACAHLFTTASYCAAILFQGLKAEGTNIIVNEQPLMLHIIARRQDDGLNFQWPPTQTDEAALTDLQERIKEAFNEETPVLPDAPPTPPELKNEEEKENYLVQQLIRQP